MLKQRKHSDDKIFNNSYLHGEKLKGDEYEFGSSLKIDVSSSAFVNDLDFESTMCYEMVRDAVKNIIDTNASFNAMIDDTKKYNKDRVNSIYEVILSHMVSDVELLKFANTIYILDMVANLTGLRYENIFDFLKVEHKEKLLMELNKTHRIFKNQ